MLEDLLLSARVLTAMHTNRAIKLSTDFAGGSAQRLVAGRAICPFLTSGALMVSSVSLIVRALGLALEARDRETKRHSDRVTDLAVRLGAALGLDVIQLEALRLGARLHDLGKLSVSDTILLKPGPLEEQEWSLMREHVAEGQRLAFALGSVPPDALAIIGLHHERWDGTGYLQGLHSEAVSLAARIFTVVERVRRSK